MAGDQVALRGVGHRPDIEVEAPAIVALPQRRHLHGQLLDKLVIHRRLDVDPLHRCADLTGVDHPAPGEAVDGAVDVGVGEHQRRVLAAQLEAARNQPFTAARGYPPTGPGGTGELHVIDDIRYSSTGFTPPDGKIEHLGRADLPPALEQFYAAQRGGFRRFDQHGRAGGERGNRVHRRRGEREVPRRDHANDRVGAIVRVQRLDREQRAVRLGAGVGEKALGVISPILQ